MAEFASADQIEAIVACAAWLPYQFRDGCRTLEFVRLRRDQLKELFFLHRRLQPARWERVAGEAPRAIAPVAEVADRVATADSGPCHYIFHTGICCSTLMARALDIEGVACVLREPRPLHDLVVMNGEAASSADRTMALDVVLDLMQRPRDDGETVIVKPANIANPFIDHILEHQPHSRALLMHSSLPGFLLAMARGRRWSWARNLAAFYRDHLEFETKHTRDLLFLTDLQMAAFLWLQCQAQFARIIRDQPEGRIATLRGDIFVERPVEAIVAAAAHFGLNVNEEEAAAIVAGPVFQRHAKKPSEVFDEAAEKRNEALVKMAFGPEIEQAIEWGEEVATEVGIPLQLPAALIN